MSEMKPLDHESRRLLDEALAEVPAPSLEARIWDALSTRLDAPLSPMAAAAEKALESHGAAGLSGGATGGGVTGSAAAGAGSGGSAVIGTKIVISAIVGAVSAGSVLWYASAARQATPNARTPGVSVAAPLPAVEPPRDSIAAEAAGARAPQQAAAPNRVQSTASNEPGGPAQSSLADETRLLADAQRALSAGAPERAWTLIEAHRTRFPKGSLSPEREAARIVALCALGRVREAGRAKVRFSRAYPSSPLASRVSAACPASAARPSPSK